LFLIYFNFLAVVFSLWSY